MFSPVFLSSDADWKQLTDRLAERADSEDVLAIEQEVRNVLADVRQRGDDALLEYTRHFDAPKMTLPLRVPEKAFDKAVADLAPEDLDAIRQAADNIREFHVAQKDTSWFLTRPDGTILGQRVIPVDRAGLYVPGGKGGNTPLVSSLLMTAIPAQVAGVKEIAVVSPPRHDGTLSPAILAAAKLIGVHEVYPLGGAWAIAALAYGTQSLSAVDVIAGPGNLRVTTAKRLVQGQVGIDMLAGPSEVLILADSTADPEYIAADMLAQAEHDVLASAICLTDDAKIAEAVQNTLPRRLKDLPRSAIAEESLNKWGAIAVLPDMKSVIALANHIAPEHLEILTADPWSIFPHIHNAGAVFLGAFSPEPLGDYLAGSNHVLPTLRTARFSSALSVQTFCKRTSVIAASADFTRSGIATVARLARLEHLEAHARSIESRNFASRPSCLS